MSNFISNTTIIITSEYFP